MFLRAKGSSPDPSGFSRFASPSRTFSEQERLEKELMTLKVGCG